MYGTLKIVLHINAIHDSTEKSRIKSIPIYTVNCTEEEAQAIYQGFIENNHKGAINRNYTGATLTFAPIAIHLE